MLDPTSRRALSSNRTTGGPHVSRVRVHGVRGTAHRDAAGADGHHDSDLESGLSTHRRQAAHGDAAGARARGRQPRLAPGHRCVSAQAFADRFLDASRNGSAPDVLVFDNFGTMEGIVTKLGTFVGMGENPDIRNQLIEVTSSFDELLGPARGWTFLFTASANYPAARELALRAPHCKDGWSARSLPADLAVPELAAAHLAGDNASILRHADPERISGLRPNLEPVTVGSVAACGGLGERTARLCISQRLVSGGHHNRSRVPASRVPQDVVTVATAGCGAIPSRIATS